MVTTSAPPVESPEPENPIVAELAQMDAEGDDKEILAEIAQLNAAEEEPGPAATPAATTPEAAAPITEPVAAKPAAPPSPAKPPAIDPQVAQHIANLEQQAEAAREREDTQTLNSFVANQQRILEEQYSLTPEQAKTLAEQHGKAAWGQFQAERQTLQRVAQVEAKAQVAVQLADQYKVPVATLMQYATPQAMQKAAEDMASQGKQSAEVAALRAEVAALKKAGVPPQRFDNNRAGPVAANNDNALLDQYNSGVRTEQTRAAARRAAGA